MKIQRLRLKNFKSYADCVLDLSGLTACSIIGKNGAGKSTVIEAIVWAIYGTAKLGNKDLVRENTDYAEVELDVEIDGKLYQIDRTYDDGKMSLDLKIDGKPVAQGAKNLAVILNKAVGATKELLQESVVIPQGQLGSFIKATPSQRRDLVASILGLDKYSKAWDVAKDSLREMTVAVASRNGTIETIENQIKALPTHEQLDADMLRAHNDRNAANTKLDELITKRERMLAEDKVARDACATLDTNIRTLTKKVADTELQFDAQIAKVESDIRAGANRATSITNLRAMIPSLELRLKEANEALAEMARVTEETTRLNREIEKVRKNIGLMKEATEVCPLCGTKLGTEKWNEIVGAAENELRSLMSTLSNMKPNVRSASPNGQPEAIQRELTDTTAKIAKLEGQEDSSQILLTQLESLKSQKTTMVTELRNELATSTQALQVMKLKVNTEVGIVDSQILTVRAEQRAAGDALLAVSSTKANRETLENSLKDAKGNLDLFKAQLPQTEFVASALSPTGIPLMITDYYMPLVAQRTQELLHQMSDGKLNVKVEVTEAGTKKGIEISAGTDTYRPIESLSGGEGTRVSLALRIALSQILQEMSGCKFDCLIVDEPEYLDPDGISQFVATINTLRDQYQQIFVMSHVDTIKSSLPNAIMVTKTNEVSDAKVI